MFFCKSSMKRTLFEELCRMFQNKTDDTCTGGVPPVHVCLFYHEINHHCSVSVCSQGQTQTDGRTNAAWSWIGSSKKKTVCCLSAPVLIYLLSSNTNKDVQ